jgi:hypothetical protein
MEIASNVGDVLEDDCFPHPTLPLGRDGEGSEAESEAEDVEDVESVSLSSRAMDEIGKDLAAFRLATEKYEILSASTESASCFSRPSATSSSLTVMETEYEDPKERFWYLVQSPFPGREPTVCFWHKKEQYGQKFHSNTSHSIEDFGWK